LSVSRIRGLKDIVSRQARLRIGTRSEIWLILKDEADPGMLFAP
jgi:hypothetical protein